MKYWLFTCCLLLPIAAGSQQFFNAGPDKETCEGKPVQIGPPDFNPNLCYRWVPATNLSCADCPNPIATVETDAEYTLYITDDDFTAGFSDEVKIMVTFGNITFDQSYVKQGTEEKVTATLNEYDGSAFTWDILDDKLGCSIVSSGTNTALITPGTQYGKITVVAKKGNDMECVAKAVIDVNVGVKDIVVSDFNNPGRKARAGQTLYVITDRAVNVTAIPNSGETFAPPNPVWHEPYSESITIPDGTVEYFHNPLVDGDASFTAGYGYPDFTPTTYVEEVPSVETIIPQPNYLPTISQISEKLNEKANYKDPLPPPAPQLSVELQLLGTQLKSTPVEKYNDPGWDFKYDFNLQSSISCTGEAYHPVLTKTIAFPELLGGDEIASTKVSLAIIGSFGLSAGLVKDPGNENPDWRVNSTLTADASFTLRAQASASLEIGNAWKAEVIGSANAKAGAEFTWDAAAPEDLKCTPYVNPLFAEIEMYVQRKIDPKDKISLWPKQTWELVSKYSATPIIFPLSNFFN